VDLIGLPSLSFLIALKDFQVTAANQRESMEIALYYAPTTCALAPYITLTEAGAEFEVRPINLGKGQHNSPEHLKINPKHKVPLLIVDGKTLSESVAIQIWIARTY
jgi:glutathione S-transferase